MSQQERIRKRRTETKTSKSEEASVQAVGNTHESMEQKLQEVDAAFDDYLATTNTAATGPHVVVGQKKAHKVARPLTDEELVQGFRQEGGE